MVAFPVGFFIFGMRISCYSLQKLLSLTVKYLSGYPTAERVLRLLGHQNGSTTPMIIAISILIEFGF